MSEMLKPMFIDVDKDRAKVAEMGCSFELMEQRLIKIEYSLGM